MGPLALMAKEAGIDVCGSDLAEGAIMPELRKAGIEVKIGEQAFNIHIKTKEKNISHHHKK